MKNKLLIIAILGMCSVMGLAQNQKLWIGAIGDTWSTAPTGAPMECLRVPMCLYLIILMVLSS